MDINNVFSVLYPRIENSQLKYFVIKELFVEFSSYQNKIADSIAKSKLQITVSDSVYLTTMYKTNPATMLPVLEMLKSAQILKDKLYNTIIGKKD